MRPLKGKLSCAVLTWMPWERGEFTDLCTESCPYSYYRDSLLCPWMNWIPSPWSAWSSLDQPPSQWDAGPDRTWREGHMAPQTNWMLPGQLQTAVSALSECQSWAVAPTIHISHLQASFVNCSLWHIHISYLPAHRTIFLVELLIKLQNSLVEEITCTWLCRLFSNVHHEFFMLKSYFCVLLVLGCPQKKN